MQFRISSFRGDPLTGTCLYLKHDNELPEEADRQREDPFWDAYTIRPNANETIEMAETWIVKRKWNPW